MMSRIKAVMFVIIFMSIAGCATQVNTKDAIRIVAYGEGDRSNTEADLIFAYEKGERSNTDTDLEKIANSDATKQGLIYEFRAGDTIRMSIQINGSLAEAAQAQPIDIILKKNLWLFMKNGDWWASLDGDNFHRFDELSDNKCTECNSSFSVGLGTSAKSKSNNLDISLVLNY